MILAARGVHHPAPASRRRRDRVRRVVAATASPDDRVRATTPTTPTTTTATTATIASSLVAAVYAASPAMAASFSATFFDDVVAAASSSAPPPPDTPPALFELALASPTPLGATLALLGGFAIAKAVVYWRVQFITAAMIGRHVPPTARRVLEYGVGAGKNLYYYPKTVGMVVGVDPDAKEDLLIQVRRVLASIALVPIRPRRRGERRSLRTFSPGAAHLSAQGPTLSIPTHLDAFQLRP
jgi:hypothetical protein